MKRIIIFVMCLMSMASCQEEYELNIGFTEPESVYAPSSVELVAGSSGKIVFSWDGGGADDGMYVQYEILFDKKGGDFSNPLYVQSNDLGGVQQASITQSQLNQIAKAAGALPTETAHLKWTIRTSKGGVSTLFKHARDIDIIRFDGLSEIPQQLYLYGTATENSGEGGRVFGKRSEGIFVIYTKLSDGNVYFTNGTSTDATRYYIDSSNAFKEGNGTVAVSSSGTFAVRVTIDFGASKMNIESVTGMKMIWYDSDMSMGSDEDNGYNAATPFNYQQGGKFVMTDLEMNVVHRNPGWGQGEYHDDNRYYFVAKIGSGESHLRNFEEGSATLPTISTPESYYLIDDVAAWTYDRKCWWRLSNSFRDKSCDVTLYTGEDGRLYHSMVLAN